MTPWSEEERAEIAEQRARDNADAYAGTLHCDTSFVMTFSGPPVMALREPKVRWPPEIIKYLSETTPRAVMVRRASQTYWYRGYTRVTPHTYDEPVRDRRARPRARTFYSPDIREDAELGCRRYSRAWKTNEARYSRRERIAAKRARGRHMLRTWMASGRRSLEWTTCGGWVWGPPKGEWKDYPKGKGQRQREARQRNRTAVCGACIGTGWIGRSGERHQCHGCLPKRGWYTPTEKERQTAEEERRKALTFRLLFPGTDPVLVALGMP